MRSQQFCFNSMQVYMFASFYYSSKAELNRIWVNGIKEN